MHGLLKKKKLGYQPFTGNPNEQLQIKVKNGVVYSKFLKYKFKLPEGAQLERFNYNSVWLDKRRRSMAKNRIITVQDIPITVSAVDIDDYICITDMAAAKLDNSRAADVIKTG